MINGLIRIARPFSELANIILIYAITYLPVLKLLYQMK